jgi:hypothetical protein
MKVPPPSLVLGLWAVLRFCGLLYGIAVLVILGVGTSRAKRHAMPLPIIAVSSPFSQIIQSTRLPVSNVLVRHADHCFHLCQCLRFHSPRSKCHNVSAHLAPSCISYGCGPRPNRAASYCRRAIRRLFERCGAS